MTTTSFDLQVAGHPNILSENDIIYKPYSPIESLFYTKTSLSPPFIPAFLGIKVIKDDKFIALENIVSPFVSPCIIDVKIGRILYGKDATIEKKQRMIHQATITTSGVTGIRICGLLVKDPQSNTLIRHDKQFGRSLTVDNLITGFRTYFTNGNDEIVNVVYIDHICARLKALANKLRTVNERYYGASVLIIYEGSNAWNEAVMEPHVDVRLIDFAHSHVETDESDDLYDTGALFGIENMIKIFERIKLDRI